MWQVATEFLKESPTRGWQGFPRVDRQIVGYEKPISYPTAISSLAYRKNVDMPERHRAAIEWLVTKKGCGAFPDLGSLRSIWDRRQNERAIITRPLHVVYYPQPLNSHIKRSSRPGVRGGAKGACYQSQQQRSGIVVPGALTDHPSSVYCRRGSSKELDLRPIAQPARHFLRPRSPVRQRLALRRSSRHATRGTEKDRSRVRYITIA